MTQKALETLVGILVVAVAAAFLLFMFQNRAGSSAAGYTLGANFYRAEGISVGTEVRLAGIPIGKVSSMSLNKDTLQAEVKIGVENDIKIPADSEISVASDGLLGDAFVEIVPGADVASLEDGGTFVYVNDSVSLINLMASFASGSTKK